MEEVNIHPFNSSQEEEPAISLGELWRHMRNNWKWYVVSIVICLTLGSIYILSSKPMYSRTSEVLLKDDSNASAMGSFDLSQLMTSGGAVPPSILNEMFILKSPEIMQRVVMNLGLNQQYTTPKYLYQQMLYRNSPVEVQLVDSTLAANKTIKFRIEVADDCKTFTLSKFREGKRKYNTEVTGKFGQLLKTPVGSLTVYETKFMHPVYGPKDEVKEVPHEINYTYVPVKACTQTFLKRLNASYVEDTGDVISLAISCETEKMCEDILKGIVEAYNDRWIDERNQTSMATANFIDERLQNIESELGEVENTITDFKSQHKMLDMEAMANIYLTQSAENQKQLQALAQEMAVAEYVRKSLNDNDLSRLLPATAAIAGTDLHLLIDEYNQAVADRNLKLQTMPDDSPLIIRKTDAIRKMRSAVLESVETALRSLNERYKTLALDDRKTQSQMASAPGQAKYLMSEERKQKVKETLYVYLLQRREENQLNSAFTEFNTRMVTEPYGESKPTSPKKTMILGVALLMALIIPTVLIYMREAMNTKVRSRNDIDMLPLPFLGEIPLMETPKTLSERLRKLLPKRKRILRGPEKRPLIINGKTSIVTEAFRMVRTNLDFIDAISDESNANATKGKVVMSVSLNSGSGKTFVNLNVAAAYAVNGKKVCIVDFDLRKGTVSQSVGNPPHGLTDYLTGKNQNLDSLLVHNVEGIAGLDMLPEGIRPPNPTEMLYSKHLKQLFDELRSRYDMIFLDCPPIEIVADARILNEYCNITIFVLRAGVFEKADLKTINNIYNQKRYKNLALVLNATDRVHGLYGHYGYGQNYVYGASHS